MAKMDVPRPDDDVELERLIARFARVFLGDPHAHRRGRSGQPQHGIDVLATDQRTHPGEVWGFQARCVAEFTVADLDRLVEELSAFKGRLDHYVVIATVPRSVRLQDSARKHTETRGHVVAVWDWEQFGEHLIRECGSGPWMAARDREHARAMWCADLRRSYEERRPLHPLPLPPGLDARLVNVFVEPDLRWVGGPGTTAGAVAQDAREIFRASAQQPVLLVGDAGSGKSTVLARWSWELADWGVEDPDAPVPVVVSASDLAEGGADAVRNAHAAQWPGPLWCDPTTDWVVLVDALDEMPVKGFDRACHEIDRLTKNPRVHGLGVACRGTHVDARLLPGARRLRIASWRGDKQGAFSGRWNLLPDAHTSTGAFPVTTPLELTLAAVYAVDPTTPGAPWFARERMLDAVLEEWSALRAHHGSSFDRDLLEVLALGAVARGGTLPRADRIQLGVAVEEGPLARFGLRTGILSLDAAGDVQFRLPVVAETLAARAIARGGIDTLAVASSQRETMVAAHLAVLASVIRDGTKMSDIVSRLAAGREGAVEEDLRRLGVVVRAILDVGAEGPELKHVSEVLVGHAADERSRFVREVAGELLTMVATTRGPLWDAIQPELTKHFAAGPTRRGVMQAWLDAGAGLAIERGSPGYWFGFMLEEDPSVRSLAVAQLARMRDTPERRTLLLAALLDHGHGHFSTAPAVVAGAALREAEPRDAPFIRTLNWIARTQRQFPSGGAAVALRPDEAPTELLTTGLRELWNAQRVREVFEAVSTLRATEHGRETLNRLWPTAPTDLPSTHVEPVATAEGDRAPLSQHVREQLAGYAALAFSEASYWTTLPRDIRWQPAFLSKLCDGHAHEPARLAGLFCDLIDKARADRNTPFLPPRVQEVIGAAAVIDGTLGEKLVAWWDERIAYPLSSFPGIAFETLATRGNADAARAYAEWLPSTPFMMLLGGYQRPPSQEVLALQPVSIAARDWAMSCWDFATVGREDSSGRRFLAPQALGLVLHGLWPSWRDTSIAAGLLDRAAHSVPEWFFAAAHALLPGGLPEPIAAIVVQSVSRWREEKPWDLDRLLWLVDEGGLIARVGTAIEEIAREGEGSSFWAAASIHARSRIDARSRCRVSRIAAARFPGGFSTFDTRPRDLAVLVDAAPTAWVDAWERAAQWWQWTTDPLLLLARTLLPRVRGRLRERIFKGLRFLRAQPLPWVAARGWSCTRVGDAAASLLWEMDLEPR